MFMVGVPTSSVLGPAWVYFYIFPGPGAAAFWLLSAQGTACGPLLGMTEVVVAGLQFIFKSGFG